MQSDSLDTDVHAISAAREVEYGIVASCLFSEDALIEIISSGITPEWFSLPSASAMYGVCLDLYTRRTLPNLEVVSIEIERTKAYANKTVTKGDVAETTRHLTSSYPYLIAALSDAHKRRLLRSAFVQVNTRIADASQDADEIAEFADATIQSIISTATDTANQLNISEAVAIALDPDRGKMDISTGFTDLDARTTGFHPKELVLVGARPSMGKTALMGSLALNIASHGTPVGIFTLEMDAASISERLICAMAGVSLKSKRMGKLGKGQSERINRAGESLSRLPIHFDETSSPTISHIRSVIRKWIRSHGTRIIFLDYLQLIQPPRENRNDNREREISKISNGLKAAARDLDVTIIALAQLSRKNEIRPDKRPVLSDLRDSGSLEQDADLVIFLHRPEYYKQKTLSGRSPEGVAELNIAKNRQGETGATELFFNKELMSFHNLERFYGKNVDSDSDTNDEEFDDKYPF